MINSLTEVILASSRMTNSSMIVVRKLRATDLADTLGRQKLLTNGNGSNIASFRAMVGIHAENTGLVEHLSRNRVLIRE